MLPSRTLVFPVIALVAAVPGFSGLASAAGTIARSLFGIFPGLVLLSLPAGAGFLHFGRHRF